MKKISWWFISLRFSVELRKKAEKWYKKYFQPNFLEFSQVTKLLKFSTFIFWIFPTLINSSTWKKFWRRRICQKLFARKCNFSLYVTTELSDLVIFWKKKKKNRLSFFQWSVKEANIEWQQKKMVYCSMNHDELQFWSGKKSSGSNLWCVETTMTVRSKSLLMNMLHH